MNEESSSNDLNLEGSSNINQNSNNGPIDGDSIFVEFRPNANLPVYPTYATQVINGIKYKVYLESSWEQITTADGISLKDLINSLPVYEIPEYYHYKGYLRNKPKKSAMEQLLEITNPMLLDVYLVQRDYVADGDFVSEIYTWYGNGSGWVYMGSTNPVGTIRHALPGILGMIPEELGEPSDFLLVNEDGNGIIWANPLRDHNIDPTAHPDIRKLIDDIVKPKIRYFNDILSAENWVYNPISEYYEYDYSSENIPELGYFEITPMVDDLELSEEIRKAEINPAYPIVFSETGIPHAIVRANYPPQLDIPISIHVLGQVEDVEPDSSGNQD